LLRGVVPRTVPFGSGKNLEECRIGIRDPVTERESAKEYGNSGQQAVEEIEDPDRCDADKKEQGALNA
jgi:hypothetical protein